MYISTTDYDSGTPTRRPAAGPHMTTATDNRAPSNDDRATQTSATPVRVAVYVRTAPGSALRPCVLKTHVRRLRDYIDSRPGWAFTGLAFHDAASAATLDQPGLNEVLAAAQTGAFDVLLVDRLDRLSRSIR